jgi:hypothetical protein
MFKSLIKKKINDFFVFVNLAIFAVKLTKQMWRSNGFLTIKS